jgi:ABC-type nitrate/sulfonate/bicarbonate transport system substrate-binding protein
MPLNRPASRRLIAAAALVILFGTPAFAQQTRLSVGYVGINSDNVIAFIAKETGIFARNGLDVELIYFGGGSTATMACRQKPS